MGINLKHSSQIAFTFGQLFWSQPWPDPFLHHLWIHCVQHSVHLARSSCSSWQTKNLWCCNSWNTIATCSLYLEKYNIIKKVPRTSSEHENFTSWRWLKLYNKTQHRLGPQKKLNAISCISWGWIASIYRCDLYEVNHWNYLAIQIHKNHLVLHTSELRTTLPHTIPNPCTLHAHGLKWDPAIISTYSLTWQWLEREGRVSQSMFLAFPTNMAAMFQYKGLKWILSLPIPIQHNPLKKKMVISLVERDIVVIVLSVNILCVYLHGL